MEKFSDFISEQKNEQPYDLLVVSHDGIDDVNETGPLIKNTGKKMGLNVFLAEMMGAYMEGDGVDKVFYSFPVSDEGKAQLPKPKDDVEYQKPFKISPDKTLIMMRGLHPMYGCESWNVMAQNLEKDGYKLVNSVKCNEICNDKWFNYTVFQRENIQTPKSILVRHSEDALRAAEKLGNKFPMILKTTIGSIGVGVMFVESAKALSGIVQLLYRENRYIDILLQEYIKTDYDVRVIVLKNKVMGAMKRPIVKGDFRSNVSQGSEPTVHELTELERSEALRAAKAVEGDVVGAYLHGHRIGVVVTLNGGNEELARDIAMHVAASNPQFLDSSQVSEEAIAKEKEIFLALNADKIAGKPENIVENMVKGRINKFVSEGSLIEQPFVKDPEVKVGELAKKASAEVVSFVRFEVGEGIERAEADFAAEVAAQLAAAKQ